ncbi:MAG: 1-acyl-sn-glycerol-3-phosphate acyltransferase [Holophagaceae bacterium]|nr:1-acyl-sn-glycerol-3-phosphate acyltransferase [Holophagaceae bacterium]
MSRALNLFSRAVAGLWFRSIRMEGGPLPDGPVLLVLNHPNGLLDPLVPSALLHPAPRFMAKATLWNLLPLRPLLAFFASIPVRRAADEGAKGADPARNQEAFDAVFAALGAGDRVGLFPEGISHGHAALAPLKTGAARLALGAPVPVALVPAGLVYGDKEVWRHSVLLRLGAPIPFDDLRSAGPAPEAVRELTARIRAALLPLTLHVDQEAHADLAQRLAWLLAGGPAERADLERLRLRVRSLLAQLEAAPPGELTRIHEGVAEAEDWLASKGLRPDQVGHDYARDEVKEWLPRALGHGAAALLLAPFALLFWPPYRALGWLVGRINDDSDQTATYKVLGAALFFPAWILLLAVASWKALGWSGLLFGVAAALVALASLPLRERLAEDLQALRGWRHRKDPEAPALLEAKGRLLARFPDLA